MFKHSIKVFTRNSLARWYWSSHVELLGPNSYSVFCLSFTCFGGFSQWQADVVVRILILKCNVHTIELAHRKLNKIWWGWWRRRCNRHAFILQISRKSGLSHIWLYLTSKDDDDDNHENMVHQHIRRLFCKVVKTQGRTLITGDGRFSLDWILII